MLKENEHQVFHYGAEGSSVECDEHINVVSHKVLDETFGENHRTQENLLNTQIGSYAFKYFDVNTEHELLKRLEPGDFVCMMWNGHEDLYNEVANSQLGREAYFVEPAVGYKYGCFTRYRAFASKAFQAFHYGMFDARNDMKPEEEKFDPNTYTTNNNPDTFMKLGDAVIPHALDLSQFTLQKEKGDYLLYVGRIVYNKGVEMAVKVAERLGTKLIIAGQGNLEAELGYEPPKNVEVVGVVSPEERNELMGKAIAGLGFTRRMEAFGYVGAEFGACGTPFYCYPFGGFSEIVIDGVTGFHCPINDFKEICELVKKADTIDPEACRKHIEQTYSLDVVGKQYDTYFKRLAEYIPRETKGLSVFA